MPNEEQANIRSEVIKRIQSDLSGRFLVFDNTGQNRKVFAGQIPDIILFKKGTTSNDEVLFVLKVENGGELVDSVPQWKELGNAPSTFYVVVPRNKLDEAKKLTSATGVKARFAQYEIDGGEVKVQYE